MATTERQRLLDLRNRLGAVLQSEEAQSAPRSMRRLLWLAAVRIYRLRGKRPAPADLDEAIRLVDQTIETWNAWLGDAQAQKREGAAEPSS